MRVLTAHRRVVAACDAFSPSPEQGQTVSAEQEVDRLIVDIVNSRLRPALGNDGFPGVEVVPRLRGA
jgi:hypothetical protein